MTNLDSLLKSRDITLPTNVHIVKAMVFPVVLYGCENWTIKKAENQRTDAFELRYWIRLLRVPWTARSNQSILKEMNPKYSLGGLILKFQYSDHVMQRADSMEKTLMLGNIEGGRKRGRQRMRWLDRWDGWTWLNGHVQFSSVQSLVVSDSFWPHGLQHTRLPCPSPTPAVYSNSCPLSRWCHPTISSSIIPFSSHLQSFPPSGSFQMSQFFTSDGQSIGVSASASVLP